MSNVIRSALVHAQAVVVGPEGQTRLAGNAPGQPEGLEAGAQAALELEQYRRRAQEEAQALLEQAAAAAEVQRAQAREEGFQEGMELARRQTAEAIERLGALAGQARVDMAELLRSVEREAVELVLFIARRVVEGELQVRPEAVTDTVRRALASMDRGTVVRIRMHPQDVELLEDRWQEVSGEDPSLASVERVADAFVQPGGCVIDALSGSFDAQPQTLLETLERAFREHHRGAA